MKLNEIPVVEHTMRLADGTERLVRLPYLSESEATARLAGDERNKFAEFVKATVTGNLNMTFEHEPATTAELYLKNLLNGMRGKPVNETGMKYDEIKCSTCGEKIANHDH